MAEKYADSPPEQVAGPATTPIHPDSQSTDGPQLDAHLPPYGPTDTRSTPDGKPPLPPRRSKEKSIDGGSSEAARSQRYSTDEEMQSDEVHDLGTAEPVSDNLPEATHPTVALVIPFPIITNGSEKHKDKIPPFVLYAPMAASLTKPAEGEKESLQHKAIRKWEEEEREANQNSSGFKSKAVKLIAKGMSATKNSRIEFLVRTPNKKKLKELRIIYPASYEADDMKQRFTDMIKSAKNGAILNGVISTAMLPFVLAFDTVTFIPGPFEVTTVWAASSWTGAARASGISSRITSSNLPVSLTPDPRLDAVSYRLHEICWRKLKKARAVMGEAPRWPPSGGPIKRGSDLAGQVLEVLRAYGEDMSDVETDRLRVSEDLERCLKKGATEWAKLVE